MRTAVTAQERNAIILSLLPGRRFIQMLGLGSFILKLFGAPMTHTGVNKWRIELRQRGLQPKEKSCEENLFLFYTLACALDGSPCL